MADDYSGTIDWDDIYNTFHDPTDIASRIKSILGPVEGLILFCGFPKVASLLSDHYEIMLIDNSPNMVGQAQDRYANIHSVVLANIETLLHSNAAKTVVISGRLSAFWQNTAEFLRLAESITAHARDQVLIDYFDITKAWPGLEQSFSATNGTGFWRYQHCGNSPASRPPIRLVELDIDYTLSGNNVSYRTLRAFFDAEAIAAWHRKAFPDYRTRVTKGLLQDDPSFSITMTSNPPQNDSAEAFPEPDTP
ncbi:hypothetical protein [Marinobacter alexandrii]|uniref:hypothetical protein n=1 Tax=Marinobacter alexandrii TaxID=2570351 RepID=UPI003267AFA5